MPADLGQEFLDAAVQRVKKVTPRRVPVRAWIGSGLVRVDRHWPEPGQRSVLPSRPLVEPWEPEPPERRFVWIELRRRRFLFPEREVTGLALEDTDVTEVLEHFLETLRACLSDRVRACEARIEIGSEKISWWYECDGKPVLRLEPLPLDLLPDEPGEGEGGSGVREPRRPSPNAPPAPDAIDPAA